MRIKYRYWLTWPLRACVICFAGINAIAESGGQQEILFLGDSLTDGYTIGMKHSYPTLIQGMLDQKGLRYRVINAGRSGDTAEQALARLPKYRSQRIALALVALGANDAFQQLPIAETKRALSAIISQLKEWNGSTKIVLAGVKPLVLTSKEYEQALADMYRALSSEYGVPLIPNLLQGVQGVLELNISDEIHPNAAGHKVMADVVAAKLLEQLSS
ncbi:MAG: arylesterase [Proteobacteria bacterium]|nr:MAG: arylesterase [Pseudomonadota bacterium]